MAVAVTDEVGVVPSRELERHREGFAHGRFQVLHMEHLEYLLAAAERCDFLHVGITQPDVDGRKPSSGAGAIAMIPPPTP
ncbi:hypothetical protein V2I01_16940 [Micromonospora sp. BRA006-A]|nr:hypothetical protein [Micromonospora sp. BRA006-A]